MRTSGRSAIGVGLLLLLPFGSATTAWATTWQDTVVCAPAGVVVATESTDRGFYLPSYSGNNLSQVTLYYATDTGQGGLYSISLTARRNSFDGPVIGSTQIRTVVLTDLTVAPTPVTFDFGGAPVTPGDTIAFTQSAQNIDPVNGPVLFDVGGAACTTGSSIETNATVPPLDGQRNTQIGITVTEHVNSATCVASDTVMCLDDSPGDQRFKVTATFSTTQGGGSSGNAQAIPVAPLGVLQGGMFWFFRYDNPELLVKVLNGCSTNSHFWVFASAGTSVAVTITVTDTTTAAQKVYTNTDGQAMAPVQDITAFVCP
jgi:hypothetical protein